MASKTSPPFDVEALRAQMPSLVSLSHSVEEELARGDLTPKQRAALEERRARAMRALFCKPSTDPGWRWHLAFRLYQMFLPLVMAYGEGVGSVAFKLTCTWVGSFSPESGRLLAKNEPLLRRALKAWGDEFLRQHRLQQGEPVGEAKATWAAIRDLFAAIKLPAPEDPKDLMKRFGRLKRELRLG